MLSAAHDLLKEEKGTNGTIHNNTLDQNIDVGNGTDPIMKCNPIGTGAILLADILPTLIVKLLAPFFVEKLSYNIRVIFCIICTTAALLIVGLFRTITLTIIGVCFGSISAGLGEITFLALMSFYDKSVIGLWSSGTGAAGILGSLFYAVLTTLHVSPRVSILIVLIIPIVQIFSYLQLPNHPFTYDLHRDDDGGGERNKRNYETITHHQEEGRSSNDVGKIEEDKRIHNLNESFHEAIELSRKRVPVRQDMSIQEKLNILPSLLKYMIPLSLVYFFEYFINQTFFELVYYGRIFLSSKQQYQWFQVDYQLGVFISRSSLSFFKIKKLWLLPILQFANLLFIMFHVLYCFIPNISIIFIFIFWEGLLGGSAYVNTFYQIREKFSADIREYCLGVASLGDSFGIVLSGILSVPSHNSLCHRQIRCKYF
ncbi:hypothetical protein SNEBB_000640 [Seison nebaliae]|nr:hypothetical protein SNEBB_000640 [Seison nebaliae]